MRMDARVASLPLSLPADALLVARIVETDVGRHRGAGHDDKSAERTTIRNGDRDGVTSFLWRASAPAVDRGTESTSLFPLQERAPVAQA